MNVINIISRLYSDYKTATAEINNSIFISAQDKPDVGLVIHTGITFLVSSESEGQKKYELLLNTQTGTLIKQLVLNPDLTADHFPCLGLVYKWGNNRFDTYELKAAKAFYLADNTFKFKEFEYERKLKKYVHSNKEFKIIEKDGSTLNTLPKKSLIQHIVFDGQTFFFDSDAFKKSILEFNLLLESFFTFGEYEYDEEEEREMRVFYSTDFEDEEESRYSGSYAREVEELSDDFIDDVLDGDPDAYWNID